MRVPLTVYLFAFIVIGCNTVKKQDHDESNQTANAIEPGTVSLESVWSTDSIFDVPESVCYDGERNYIYVSNIVGDPTATDGNGFISRLDPDGTVNTLKWIEGLDAPKGMGILMNFLYVADLTNVVVINVNDGKFVERYHITGSVMLNDISIGPGGRVFVSDSGGSKIFSIRNGSVESLMEGEPLHNPNGLYCLEDVMMVASSGDGQLKRIGMNDLEVTVIANGLNHADGIAKDSRGNYLVSNWEGQIFYIRPDGQMSKLLDTRDKKINSADIDLIVKEDMLLVPTFFDNRVMAYKLVVD